MKFISVDVSELPPPEPMTIILTALSTLKSYHCLRVTHRRQPFPLYEKLVEAGWAYHCEIHTGDHITLFIYRQTDHQLFKENVDMTI